MATFERADATDILLTVQQADESDHAAISRVFELVYDELRSIAGAMMQNERSTHTLRPTELVHEAYCRLVDQTRVNWQNRAHFFGIAARAMREVLVDYARRRASKKRGGGWQRLALDDRIRGGAALEAELLDLDDALTRLKELDERMARVVELRVFGGLLTKEVAHVLGVSRKTVERDWRVAKMWLSREFGEGDHT
jgi:RNA polymerase sigma factor (TIGR02999 family)